MKLTKNKTNILIISGILLLIIVVSTLSYTYAYFAFSAKNTNKITGTGGTPDLELSVEKIIPTTTNNTLKLVPLLDNALSNAIVGTGGQSSCVDSKGNLSCQIYKITVENTGTINLVIKGTIELKATGSNNIFQNIKWRQLETINTIKSGSTINGMTKSTLVDNVTITPNVTKTYYFALWISEINEDQSTKDNGDFFGTVNFMDSTGKGATATFTN